MVERVYCSEANGDEPMVGTADRVDAWVLLEYRPAWGARAVDESALAPATRRWLNDNLAALEASGVKARPQLIRRPEADGPDRRKPDAGEVHLFVGVPGRLVAMSGRDYGFLDGVSLPDLLREPEAFPAAAQPHYFVCTNGRRDLCCARFGLPAYAALRERVGDRAWQVTHLGGHRFAPNVLVLPQGALYGRVTPDAVARFVTEVEAGRLAFPQLRGRTWYPPPAQAAEALAGRSDLELLGVEEEGGAERVAFRAPEGRVTLAVRRADRPLEVRKSCADAAPAPVRPYQLHQPPSVRFK